MKYYRTTKKFDELAARWTQFNGTELERSKAIPEMAAWINYRSSNREFFLVRISPLSTGLFRDYLLGTTNKSITKLISAGILRQATAEELAKATLLALRSTQL